jgi:hypothetical protein
MLLFLLQNLLEPRSLIISACKRTVVKPARRCREPREHWRHIHEVALEASGSDRAQVGGQQQGHGAVDSQGDPCGGVPHPARRGGRDDTKEAGGERASGEYLAGGARGRAVAGDVLLG